MKTLFLFAFITLFVLVGFSQEQYKMSFNAGVSKILENISEPVFPERIFQISAADLTAGDWNDFINEKIRTCSEAGGGRVVLDGGTYFCNGPVVLLSNVNLHLKENARLVFGQNPEDYLPEVFVRWEGTEAYNYSPFIYAKDAENIAITGKGTIDGNGLAENSFRSWRSRQKEDQNKLREMGRKVVPVEERIFGAGSFLRPQLIHFVNCKNIYINGIEIDTAQTGISFTNRYHSYSRGEFPSLFENIRIENQKKERKIRL